MLTCIILKEVNFDYDPKHPILFDVSFEIPEEHTVAVVGESGSDKSKVVVSASMDMHCSSGHGAL